MQHAGQAGGATNSPPHARAIHRRGLRRWLYRFILIALVALIALELYARFGLGLGDPPLVMTDPEIEYLFQPSRRYHRFGHRIEINSHSMRAEEFPARRSDPREIRILVIGDSIVFGTTQVDQADIATERLKVRLRDELDRPVVVGNASAGSWGPENELAYVRTHGFFDADVIIIVFNSPDASDRMMFTPLPSFMPTRRPVLALEEAWTRYLPRYLGRVMSDPVPEAPPTEEDTRRCLDAARDLIGDAVATGAAVAVAFHLTPNELSNGPDPSHERLVAVARGQPVSIVHVADFVRPAFEAGEPVFQDEIHLNARGQELLAEALYQAVTATGAARQPSP
jgi:lysophospholipase L1-like esterase